MDWTLEVVVVPVGDTDRAIAFYRDKLGFNLDHHTQAHGMDFAQLTPQGSGCSIVIGDLPGGRSMEPGSLKGLQLVVADATRAHDERDGGTMFEFLRPRWQRVGSRSRRGSTPFDSALKGDPGWRGSKPGSPRVTVRVSASSRGVCRPSARYVDAP